MSKEAMKLALEALEDVDGIDTETECVTIDVGEAITALREALAEDVPEVGFGNTALDKMAENARELGLDYEPAQQEPVARVDANDEGYWADILPDRTVKVGQLLYAEAPQPAQQEPVAYWIPKAEQFCIADPSGRPFAKAWESLYTSPPAQRTWVGLTDEEIDKTHETKVWDARRSYARAIGAKLKEKNT